MLGRLADIASKGGKDVKVIHIQAMAFSDALRTAMTTNNSGGSEFPIYGFTSKIGEDVEMYADGEKLEISKNEATKDGYLMPYGVKVEQSKPYDLLTLKNLTLAALPGYTFQVSYDKALYLASDSATRELPSWNATDTTVSAAPAWPVVPNNLEDDGVRAPLAPTATAFAVEIGFEYDGALKITFSAPVNPKEFGFGCDFAKAFDLAWADDNTAVTVTFDQALAAGEEGHVVIFRLRDVDGNMIGVNGIAGPVEATIVGK